jgi:multicomponent Na+:H+ antiporter subunit E
MSKLTVGYSFLSYCFRTLFFAIIWLTLVEGNLNSWVVGALAILACSLISIKLIPPLSLKLSALMPFFGFFLWRSLLGGIDVAKRVLRKTLLIDPEIIYFQIEFNNEYASALFINTVNLLPGTLVIDSNNNLLEIHVLDKNMNNVAELKDIELRILRLFQLDSNKEH